MNIFNFKNVSRALTGGDESVRLHRVPKVHQEAVNELKDFEKQWLEKWGK